MFALIKVYSANHHVFVMAAPTRERLWARVPERTWSSVNSIGRQHTEAPRGVLADFYVIKPLGE